MRIMNKLNLTLAAVGLCTVMTSQAALADTNPFLGHWHWNKAQSALAPDEPAPKDVVADVSRADSGDIKWTATMTDHKDQSRTESFSAAPDGTFHEVEGAGKDTMAAFTLNNGQLQSTFKNLTGGTDTQTCSVSADHNVMTCKGIWSDGKGDTAPYTDVYDRF